MKTPDLRKLCEGAIPGPWDARCNELSNTARPRHLWSEYGWFGECFGVSPVENAAFIAAANPQAVLALLDRLDAMEEALDEIYRCEEAAVNSPSLGMLLDHQRALAQFAIRKHGAHVEIGGGGV